ncbi:MAG TPA: type II toxin-antitoxin system ParD family antitoxin [Agriterribacter sp.]|nr:type II toxin-antitoxin system ParD family antitoxin [Agriterribacter sp.]HRQ49080.1 type II toxin-antitoxin system ParD family antitoxin [Agriterribacter sp.]
MASSNFENIPGIDIFMQRSGLWQKIHQFSPGDYFDNFIRHQIQGGRFSSASEVVRAALRLFEQEENKKKSSSKNSKKVKNQALLPNLTVKVYQVPSRQIFDQWAIKLVSKHLLLPPATLQFWGVFVNLKETFL